MAHLTAVKMAVAVDDADPQVYWAWCETCHRDIGPRVEDADLAEQIAAEHEKDSVVSDDVLLTRVHSRVSPSTGSGRKPA
jgi:hypothetical protein